MPLREIAKTSSMWLPVCDNCGALYGAGEFTANGRPFDGADQARVVAKGAGWRVFGKVYICPTCVRRAPGEAAR